MFHRLAARVSTHLALVREKMRDEPDAGYTTETILITALMVVLALGALAILTTKVMAKINGVSL